MMRKQSALSAQERDSLERIAGDTNRRTFFATPLASRYSKGEERDKSLLC